VKSTASRKENREETEEGRQRGGRERKTTKKGWGEYIFGRDGRGGRKETRKSEPVVSLLVRSKLQLDRYVSPLRAKDGKSAAVYMKC